MDLKKYIYRKKSYDKIGLGYIEPLPSSVSKVIGNPKEKGGQSQKSKSKSDNIQKYKI
jgi:hypothetical protein